MVKKEQQSDETKQSREAFRDEIERLVRGWLSDPFEVLGPHWKGPAGSRSLRIRIFRPGAADAEVVWIGTGEHFPAKQIHPAGLFEAELPLDLAHRCEAEPLAPD